MEYPVINTEKARDHFFKDIAVACREASHTRSAVKTDDFNFLQCGVMRVMMKMESGRDFVQHMQMAHSQPLSVSSFFKMMSSLRRARMTEEVAEIFRKQLDEKIRATPSEDPLSDHPELNGFAIYSADGHSHDASTHETPCEQKKYPVTHTYSLNLRSRSCSHNQYLDPDPGKKKMHEMKALKRRKRADIRMNEPCGTKVILVYDLAVTDYIQWFKWKQGSGVYVVTKQKCNAALQPLHANEWNRADARNHGVSSDEMVRTPSGVLLRRIRHQDPISGEGFNFLTTEFNLPPGLIAFLYSRRWNIEKMFDEFKNSFHEEKAWGKSPITKKQQALFLSIAHNLLISMEFDLKLQHQISDQKVARKRAAQLALDMKKAKQAHRPFNSLFEKSRKATKSSMQFVRWVRHCFAPSTLWTEALAILAPLMLNYLS